MCQLAVARRAEAQNRPRGDDADTEDEDTNSIHSGNGVGATGSAARTEAAEPGDAAVADAVEPDDAASTEAAEAAQHEGDSESISRGDESGSDDSVI